MFISFGKSTISVILVCFLSSGTAYGWKMEETFDVQPLGVKPVYSGDGGIEWFSGTKTSNTQAYGGRGRSAALSITGGTSGWGQFGGIMTYPSPIKEGGEIWWRIRTFMPASYDYSSSTFALKFMRVHTRAAGSKANNGFLDLYIKPSGQMMFQSEVGHEHSPGVWWGQDNQMFSAQSNGLERLNPVVALNGWETYEVYTKFSSVPGSGIYRVWKNGVLVYENLTWNTFKSPDDPNTSSDSIPSESEAAYLFTYWNGNAPQTQTMYVDDLVVTNETPVTKDSSGNRYIGMGAVASTSAPESTSPPMPPSVE
jgi:hypothetical protein